MKRRAAVIAVVLVVAGAAWFLLASRQTEDARIRQRLGELAELVSAAGPVRGQDILIRLGKLRKFFTENVVVVIGGRLPEIRGRDQLLSMAQAALSRETDMDVSFEDIDVTVNPDELHAMAKVTVVVAGVSSDEAKSVSARELGLDMAKIDGEWLIKAIRRVEVFELDR